MSMQMKAEETDIFLHFPNFLSTKTADGLFKTIRSQTDWNWVKYQKPWGEIKTPRLSAAYGFHDWNNPEPVSGCEPRPWPKHLLELKNEIQLVFNADFNFALCFLYRSGKDSISYHSDNEKFLGPEPIIASLSLGSSRKFVLRNKNDKKRKHVFETGHGSLLIMKGRCQHEWEHSVTKTQKTVGERINVTMRRGYGIEASKNYYKYNVGVGNNITL